MIELLKSDKPIFEIFEEYNKNHFDDNEKYKENQLKLEKVKQKYKVLISNIKKELSNKKG